MSVLTWELAQPAPRSAWTTLDKAATIRRVQAGDVAAFNTLVVQHQEAAFNLAYRILGDRDLAADATQEVFLSAFRAIGRFKEGSFRAWLFRIVVNTCYGIMRASRRRPQISLDTVLEDDDEAILPEDPSASVEDVVLRRELVAKVAEGLHELPLEQRVVIVLADVQGLRQEEIATITGSALGTVKSRLSRGRSRLRDLLREKLRATIN